MRRKGINSIMMDLLYFLCLLSSSIEVGEALKEFIVEDPFYLRARVHDSHTAHVQFEIAEETNQRNCQKYKFTISRNHEYPYTMPEQNLTFWRNSLELKHLEHGDYRICAVICSEYSNLSRTYFEPFRKGNHSKQITSCISIHAYRSHFLVLTLYVLVFIILAFSQVVFTLRKRKFRAGVKSALLEVEHTLQKLRSSQTSAMSNERRHSYTILQSLLTLPAVPFEHSATTSTTSSLHLTTDEHRISHPVIFHLETTNEHPE